MKMRYRLYAACIFLLCGFSSCYHHYRYTNGDTSVNISESQSEYNMSASFDEAKTRAVQNYISDNTGNNGLFKQGGNIEMDANTTFDDNVKVHIKFHPGRLKIQFDKDENSPQAYHEIRELCEGIKELLTKP